MTEIVPTQEFELRADTEGVIELTTVFRAPISSLVLYFPSNFGGDNTIIRYIGMQGEHTHYRREAVDRVYENQTLFQTQVCISKIVSTWSNIQPSLRFRRRNNCHSKI